MVSGGHLFGYIRLFFGYFSVIFFFLVITVEKIFGLFGYFRLLTEIFGYPICHPSAMSTRATSESFANRERQSHRRSPQVCIPWR